MSLASLLVAFALVVSAPAAAAAEGGVTDRSGDPALFTELFAHLSPHAVAGFWIGGDKGFAYVDPHVPQVGEHGEEEHAEEGGHAEDGDEAGHDDAHAPVFASSSEFTDHYKAAFGGGFGFLIYNINTVMWMAALVLLLVFWSVARKAKAQEGQAPKGAGYGLAESLILFVRDQMVYDVLGAKHGRPLVPVFLTMFFFILFMNIFGLLPLGPLGGTATANIAVTAGLATFALFCIHMSGIKEHGFFKHWRNFVPHVPWFVVPIMIVVEAIGIIVKPVALTIRLFANLTAGHLIVLGLFGLTFFFGSAVIAVPTMGMAVAIYGLELFVCFVQAYIFTYLTIVFVGASLHPEH